ncbi:M23 family metallopeptidase [Corynebacterium gerontici]|uniref:Murein hydrolase activator NlpD n=1 Tax=Corynebacterium gerontici TaxID=2079234 RepID=A0A3G6J3M9_9CORY|nr:M23 family metallopeptidase [Corynebacterium gerontici]AZA11010.1 Murein hydrolase activator NlpD precursor [Corynebacterium gerontici]
MQQNQRAAAGKHRKQASPARSRVAFVALATGTVSTAGATGLALAQNQSPSIALAADSAAPAADNSPQILAIPEFKPMPNLSDQLNKAVEYSNVLAAADVAARTPKPKVHTPAEGAFTSGFGMRWGVLHAGIDIANATNTPIYSVLDGVVIDAGAASGFGQWVRVQHEDGTITVYGHVETINVTVGQKVTAGQQIAGMGSRGFSTGTHLHFEVHPGGGGPIDPIPWLANLGIVVA